MATALHMQLLFDLEDEEDLLQAVLVYILLRNRRRRREAATVWFNPGEQCLEYLEQEPRRQSSRIVKSWARGVGDDHRRFSLRHRCQKPASRKAQVSAESSRPSGESHVARGSRRSPRLKAERGIKEEGGGSAVEELA